MFRVPYLQMIAKVMRLHVMQSLTAPDAHGESGTSDSPKKNRARRLFAAPVLRHQFAA